MSRAGKFIPGGAGRKSSDASPAGSGKTGPIRAPQPGDVPEKPGSPASKKAFAKGMSLVKPVTKGQRIPIMVMSAVVCCLLVSVAWYNFAVLPMKRQAADMQQQRDAALAAQQKAQADLAQQQADLAKQQAIARATVTVDTKPTGAHVTIGSSSMTTPATFSDLLPGKISVLIQMDGYEDFKEDLTVAVDKPTDLGVVELALKTGALSVSSPQTEVSYSLTGPDGYSHEGQMPDKISDLPPGDYELAAWQRDWKLPPVTVTIQDHDNLQKEIKFPYANATLITVPPGATVRNGRIVLGQTPLVLAQQHPGQLNLSVDLPPYTLQRFVLTLPDFGNVTKTFTLQQAKDFIAACGMPMVWIPDGGFWSGKYEVRQSDFEPVAGFNPSTFRRSDLPVEQVSWETATVFCDKLNQYERKAGKLPNGYHYALPSESQWEILSGDANLDLAAMARNAALTSTQEVGFSEPNKYGLYDTLGNVWEWCSDTDDRGDHSLRGGCWLSSNENFPTADTHQLAAPKTADRFTGFRVVLVPN